MGATDVVVDMFEKVKAQEPLEPADAQLVDKLHKLSRPETPDENIFDNAPAPQAAEPDFSSEPELELVEATPSSSSDNTSKGDGEIDEITEDEFEALLDELHGSSAPGKSTSPKQEAAKAAAPAAASDNDDITDEEFEALLD